MPQLATLARRGDAVRPFLVRRLWRIYPTLVAAVALTLVCDSVGIRLAGGEALYRTTLNYDAVAALNVQAMAGNLLSLQPTFVGAFGSNGPLWTLGYLVQFYIVGALAALLWARSATLAVGAALLLGIAAALFRPEWLLLMLVWGGAGAVAALPIPSRRTATLLGAAGLALFVTANRLPPLPSIVATGVASAALVTAARTFDHVTLPRWAATGARASFAIYAFHFPLAMLTFAAWRAAGLLVWPGADAGFIVVAAMLAVAMALLWERGTAAIAR